MDDLSDLTEKQLARVRMASADDQPQLIEAFRSQNGARVSSGPTVGSELQTPRQRSKHERSARRNRAKQERLKQLEHEKPKVGGYGPGTGRGALPSMQQIRNAKNSPSLLDQLRNDGKVK